MGILDSTVGLGEKIGVVYTSSTNIYFGSTFWDQIRLAERTDNQASTRECFVAKPTHE